MIKTKGRNTLHSILLNTQVIDNWKLREKKPLHHNFGHGLEVSESAMHRCLSSNSNVVVSNQG